MSREKCLAVYAFSFMISLMGLFFISGPFLFIELNLTSMELMTFDA